MRIIHFDEKHEHREREREREDDDGGYMMCLLLCRDSFMSLVIQRFFYESCYAETMSLQSDWHSVVLSVFGTTLFGNDGWNSFFHEKHIHMTLLLLISLSLYSCIIHRSLTCFASTVYTFLYSLHTNTSSAETETEINDRACRSNLSEIGHHFSLFWQERHTHILAQLYSSWQERKYTYTCPALLCSAKKVD